MNKRKWIKYNQNILKGQPNRDEHKPKDFIKDYMLGRVNELDSEFNAASKAKGSAGLFKFIIKLMEAKAADEAILFEVNEFTKNNDYNAKDKVKGISGTLTAYLSDEFDNDKQFSKKFRNK